MNKLVSVFLFLFLAASGLVISSCEDQVQEDAIVSFSSNPDKIISTDNLNPVSFDISIDRAAPAESSITVAVFASGADPGLAFPTDP